MSDEKRHFEKLSRLNYSSWAGNARAYLATKSLWGQIDSSDPMPKIAAPATPTAAEAKELREWKQRKARAAGEIWLMIEEGQKAHVKAVEDDPKAMWDKLKEVHVQKKTGTRFDAYSALFSIRLKEGESLSDLITRVSTSHTAIKERRPSSFTLEDLDNELCSMTPFPSSP